jgi:predicted nucleic acid-binding Zn ribbon protein
MPVWCAKCGAMLPDGLEICPRCGHIINSKIEQKTDLNAREIWNLTFYILKLLLVPVLLVLGVSVLCYLVFFQ